MKQATRMMACVMLAMVCGIATAQQYPETDPQSRLGFRPGGGYGPWSRPSSAKKGLESEQPVLVGNRARRCRRTIGADLVAKAPGDGYTLLMGHVNSHGIAPNLFKKLPYDAERDFAMVAYVGYVPNVLVIHPRSRRVTSKS